MDIKSLAELQQADERTLKFNPIGLGGRMRPEDAAEFQQQVVARHDLVPTVAEGTCRSFEQLRAMFAYGVLCYDIYTAVNDRALLVFEQALRDRFIGFHQGTVTFTDPRSGKTQELAAERYEQVHTFVSRNRRWKLRVGDGPDMMAFNGMLGGLVGWARRVGLLRGQRNRAVEQAIMRLRDLVAHPSGYNLTTPVSAARTISDLAEIINHLWGSATPGGRLYPAPVGRTIVALSWDEAGGEVMSGVVAFAPRSADQELCQEDCEQGNGDKPQADSHEPFGGHEPDGREPEGENPDRWVHVLVRGVAHDWDLLHFDAKYETARYPSDWLWGPGSWAEAMEWLARERPADDEVDVLDRIFLLRYHDDLLYLPRSPDVAAGVSDEEKPGVWYLTRADSPEEAFSHQRQVLAGGYDCEPQGRCAQCPVETLGAGTWQDAMDWLAANGVPVISREMPDVKVPARMGWPRYNRVLVGSWDIPAEARLTAPPGQPAAGLRFTMTWQQVSELTELAGSLGSEAGRCAEANCWTAALMLTSGSAEAALLATACVFEPELRDMSLWAPPDDDPTRWSFGQLAEVGRKAGWLPSAASLPGGDIFASLDGQVGDAVRFANRLRNMIVHPGAYVREELKPDICDQQHMRLTYELADGILGRVFEHLATQMARLGNQDDRERHADS